MKIRSLDLIKFGPFTDHNLSFAEGNYGLHLVCGPNEAGKTTTLRALHQVLFGIPGEKKCQDRFLHAHDKLRIGAELEDSDGNLLHFIRRKGPNTTALRQADDKKKIPPEKLERLLGNIDANRFRSQFAIDYEELRAGGTGILEGGGDVATSLFAAGAGQANFAEILKSISNDCDDLYKERGAKQEVSLGITALKKARTTVQTIQLSEIEWSESRKSLDESTARRSALQEKLIALQAESGRLESIRKALQLIGQLREPQNEFDSLVNCRQLREDFPEDHRTALAEASSAIRNAEQTKTRIETLTAEIDNLHVVEELLTNATAIEERFTDLGRYRTLVKELPELKIQQEQCLKGIARLKSEIGFTEDADPTDDRSITIETRQQIRDLSAQESGISRASQTSARQLRQLQKELDETTKNLDESSTTRNSEELQAVIKRIQKNGDLEQQQSQAAESIENAKQRLAIERETKLRWSGSDEQFERLPVPSTTTVRTFEQQFVEATAKLEKYEDELNDLQRERNAKESALQRLTMGHDVPTEENLRSARTRRDEAWASVKQSIDGHVNKAAEEPENKSNSKNESPVLAYEQAVANADEIADRLRREAEKVAEKTQLISDQNELEQNIKLCADNIETAKEHHQLLEQRWQEAWKPTTIAPRHPREMVEWLSDHAQIQKELSKLNDDRQQQKAVVTKIDACRSELIELLQPFTSETTAGKSLEALLDLGRKIVTNTTTEIQKQARLEEDVARLKNDLSNAEDEATEAKESLEQWQKSWFVATSTIRTGEDITSSQANKLLDAFDQLSDLHQQLEQFSADIEKSDTAIAEFETAATQLSLTASLETSEQSAETIVAELNAALSKTRTNDSMRRDKQQQLESAQKEFRDAEAQQNQAAATLQELCQEAGCRSADELPTIEANALRRQQLQEQISGLRIRLQELAGADSVDKFIAQATEEDQTTLEPRLEQIAADVEQYKAELQTVSESIGSSSNELNKMDGSGDAAQAQNEVEQIRAKLHSDAEEYVRLKLSLTVLRNAIDRYRKNNQGPVLQKASELFRRLTLGAFTELVQEFDDAGKPVICGYRPADQSHVGVSGMSEGTCDQLYLALRLASLETWLDQNPNNPIPFIVDDILIQFDDERAAAALDIFAELSHRTQVIMFTHHQHLVDVAKETLAGKDVLSVQTLGRSVMAQTVAG